MVTVAWRAAPELGWAPTVTGPSCVPEDGETLPSRLHVRGPGALDLHDTNCSASVPPREAESRFRSGMTFQPQWGAIRIT